MIDVNLYRFGSFTVAADAMYGGAYIALPLDDIQDPLAGDGRTMLDAEIAAEFPRIEANGIEFLDGDEGQEFCEDRPLRDGRRIIGATVVESVTSRPTLEQLAESITACREALEGAATA